MSCKYYKCSGLTSVIIPNSVTSIGYSAFVFCSSLKSVIFLNTTPPEIKIDAFNEETYKKHALCSYWM